MKHCSVRRSLTSRAAVVPIASARGLIFDRQGRPLVTNVPSWTIKVRPADLPFSRRDEVAARLGKLIGMDAVQILTAIDSNPGSRFDLVRVARDVAEAPGRQFSVATGE